MSSEPGVQSRSHFYCNYFLYLHRYVMNTQQSESDAELPAQS